MISLATFCAAALPAGGQAAPEPVQRFELRIENGRLTPAIRTIEAFKGDRIAIVWSADRRSEVHLHGYDIGATIDAGATQTMAFTAHATGRFPFELHGTRPRVLLYLEVRPR